MNALRNLAVCAACMAPGLLAEHYKLYGVIMLLSFWGGVCYAVFIHRTYKG
jgi:hypothetical protein